MSNQQLLLIKSSKKKIIIYQKGSYLHSCQSLLSPSKRVLAQNLIAINMKILFNSVVFFALSATQAQEMPELLGAVEVTQHSNTQPAYCYPPTQPNYYCYK